MKTTLLNNSGIEMYGMKETILASQGNKLVLSALESTVNILPASPEVKKALMDGSSIESFEDVLLNETVYLNEKKFLTEYKKLGTKLINALEEQGLKLQHKITPTKGLVITRKEGVKADFAKKYFALTTREFNKLSKDGFIDEFMKLKMRAHNRKLTEILKVNNEYLEVELSDIYYDEETTYYNFDIHIRVKASADMNRMATIRELMRAIKEVFKIARSQYFKTFN